MNTATPPGALYLDVGSLRAFLEGEGVALSGELRWELIAGGRSNLTYRVTDDLHAWVLRRPPVAGLTPSAHDVGREYRVTQALQKTSVPVARTVVACADEQVLGAPFTLVDYVPARVLRTEADLAVLSDAEVQSTHRELIRVLVDLHAVPYQEIGLADFGRPDGFAARQVHRWRSSGNTSRPAICPPSIGFTRPCPNEPGHPASPRSSTATTGSTTPSSILRTPVRSSLLLTGRYRLLAIRSPTWP